MNGEAWLQRLEKMWLEQPGRVVRIIERGIHRVELPLLARTFLIYGAALRRVSRLRDAHHAYETALMLARRVQNLRLQAEVTQKLAILARALEGFHLSLSISREAIELYLRCRDLNGAGKTLVDLGSCFFHLDRFEDAISCHDSALGFLKPGEADHRYTAWVGLALCHRGRGERIQATAAIQKAATMARSVGPTMFSKYTWYIANFYVELGEYREAERAFGELVELYLESGQVQDAVLAAVERARILLELGETREATELTRSLKAHVIALPDDSIAAAGIAELWRLTTHGELSAAVLQKIARDIKKERGEPRPLKSMA